MMAVGNLLTLGHLLDKRFYKDALPKEYMEEQNVARFNYNLLQKHFAQHYSMMVDGQLVSPFAIFRKSFFKFAASLVSYKWRAYDETTDGKTCTPQIFEGHVAKMIQEDYAEFSWEYKLERRRPLHMHWDPLSLHIRARQPEDRAREISELEADDDEDSSDSDDSRDSEDSGDSEDSMESEERNPGSATISNRKRRGSGNFYLFISLFTLTPIVFSDDLEAEQIKRTKL